MDEIIKQVGADHAAAARLHLAWLVEQTAQSLGIMDAFTDHTGNGPFVQALVKENSRV